MDIKYIQNITKQILDIKQDIDILVEQKENFIERFGSLCEQEAGQLIIALYDKKIEDLTDIIFQIQKPLGILKKKSN